MLGGIANTMSAILQRPPFEDAPVAMTVISTENLRVLAVNPALERIVGRDSSDLLGQHAKEFFSASACERIASMAHRGTGDSTGAEVGIVRMHSHLQTDHARSTGVTVWLVPCAISPGAAVLVLVLDRLDIAPEEGAIETVDFERLAPLPGAMALLADTSWNVRSTCPQLARALGTHSGTMAGRALSELVHPDDIGLLVATAASANAATRPSSALDVRFRHRDGHWRTFAASAAPLLGTDGFDGVAITAFTHSQLHASMTRVASLVRDIEQSLEGAARVREVTRPIGSESTLSLLSAREREIVELVAGGLRVSTIADRLFIAPGTVRNHLSAIFRKFGVSSQAELTEVLMGPSDR